jgi:hypothetical protein
MQTNKITARFDTLKNEGAFLYPGFLIVKEKPDQRALPTRQSVKRRRYTHL